VPLRQPAAAFIRAALTTLTLVVALVTVGLTAPPDGVFTIRVQPVFIRLGLDLDLKIGSMHLHGSWSALSDSTTPNSTVESF
jgi:hypothetical protein